MPKCKVVGSTGFRKRKDFQEKSKVVESTGIAKFNVVGFRDTDMQSGRFYQIEAYKFLTKKPQEHAPMIML